MTIPPFPSAAEVPPRSSAALPYFPSRTLLTPLGCDIALELMGVDELDHAGDDTLPIHPDNLLADVTCGQFTLGCWNSMGDHPHVEAGHNVLLNDLTVALLSFHVGPHLSEILHPPVQSPRGILR